MIQINLLPEELRRAQKTSPSTLGLLLVATLLSCGSLSFLAYFYLNVRANSQGHVDILKEQLDNMSAQVRYADALDKERTEFQKRNTTITEIASSRMLWTQKMDRLADIVNRDSMSSRHKVWVNSLNIDSSGGREPKVTFKGMSAGDDLEKLSNFHEDLQTDEVFSAGFERFTPPSATEGDLDEGLVPPTKLQWDFQALLPTNDPRAQARAAAAAAKPAAK